MRLFLTSCFVLIFSVFSEKAVAADFFEGYILKKNDTIYCQIKKPKGIFGEFYEPFLYKEVTVLDSAGKETTYTPAQLQGFGFTYIQKKKEIKMSYMSKVPEEGKQALFMEVVLLGPKLNLYTYTFQQPMGSRGSETITVYIMEDNLNRTTRLLSRLILSGNEKRLKSYFKEQPELLKLYQEKVVYFIEDVPKFVQLVNAS